MIKIVVHQNLNKYNKQNKYIRQNKYKFNDIQKKSLSK